MNLRSLFSRSTSTRHKPRRGNARTTHRPLAQRFLQVESLEARTMLAAGSVIVGNPTVSGFSLAPGSDSGVANFAETFVDNVTNVTFPTLTGSAPQGSTVTVYAENDGGVNGVLQPGINAFPIGTAVVPGTDPTQNGTWSVTSDISLNSGAISFTNDSERTLFAQDSFDDPASYDQLNIFLDTAGPQVASVTFASNGQDVFQRASAGPTASNSALDITFIDSAIRTADFPGSTTANSALNSTLAFELGNYSLVGAHGGTIPLSSVNFTDETSIGGPGISVVQLNFAKTLPDDTYTLNISDNLENDAGNALDGLVTTTSTGPDTIILPSGNGTPGSGSFAASFAVQGGLNLGVQMTNGFQFTDLQSAVPGSSTTVAPFYKASDTVFSGNFPDPSTGLADGYSKLAAYGINNGQYRFLFQNEDGSVQSVVSPVQTAGLPVAGNFDGNASNGDEVGIFTGKAWYLLSNLSNGSLSVIKTVNWPMQGLPVVGDFDGDGIPDLATWGNGTFDVSFGADTYSEIDAIVPLSFPGVTARPVAADIDGDGISDLGLWVPSAQPSTNTPANWYFLPSGDISLNGRTTPFTPVDYQFDSSIGVPVTGIFSSASLAGQSTPTVASTIIPQALSAAPKVLAAAPNFAAAKVSVAAPTSVTINGTAGNDTIQLSAGKMPGTWVLTLDGKSQIIGSSVTTLNLNGLGGSNQLSILGTGKSETAEIWPTEAIFRSGDLTVTANSFTNTTVNGSNGSNDVVRYHDVAGNSWFVAVPEASSMTGSNYMALSLNFAKTVVVAPANNSNIANFFPSTTAASISDSKSSSVVKIADKGIAAESAFFSKVQIYGKNGAVTSTILPTLSYTKPISLFSSTALSPATSVNLRAAAAALQTNSKSGNTPIPAAVDAVLASYGS